MRRALLRRVRWTGRGAPSSTVLKACASFGLVLARGPGPSARPRVDLMRRVRTSSMTLLLGASGSGKTTLLRQIARDARRRGTSVIMVRRIPTERARRALVDALRGPWRNRLGLLARAGLAEAMLLPRRVGELSEGERARLSLALAMGSAERRPRRARLLLIDEFTSVLDRTTARGVAMLLSRWAARTPGLRVVIASPHDDVEAWLAPAVVLRAELGASVDSIQGAHAWSWSNASGSREATRRTTSPSSDSTIAPGPRRPSNASSRRGKTAACSRACS